MSTDWNAATMTEIANHIVTTHHAYLYRELPLIEALINDHLRKYWRKHFKLLDVHAKFGKLKTDLMAHLIKEETGGFPLLVAHDLDRSVSLTSFVNYIGHHLEDHAGALAILKEIRDLLDSESFEGDALTDLAGTIARIATLEADLQVHIHLEDDILFDKAKTAAA